MHAKKACLSLKKAFDLHHSRVMRLAEIGIELMTIGIAKLHVMSSTNSTGPTLAMLDAACLTSCSVQVKQAQKKVLKLRKDLESSLRTQMKKYPALQPYARKPYTTWIISVVAAGPLCIDVAPLLSVLRAIGKQQEPM